MKASQVSVCITPFLYEEKSLSGFSVRSVTAETLGDENLYLSVTWLQDATSESVIIISIDTLYIDEDLADEVYEYLKFNYKIKNSQIIFNASHTHSAPSICDDIFGAEDSAYKNKLVQAIEDAVDSAFHNLKDNVVRFCKFLLPTELVVNRRLYARDIKTLFLKKKIIMAPNYEGYVDAQCRLIVIGSDTGILFNLSCHPVFNTSNNISSDFPGSIRRSLASNFKESAFVQGFCGDIRPNSVIRGISFNSLVLFFKTLINKISFKPATSHYYDSFCKHISQAIIKNSALGSELHSDIKTRCFLAELRSETGLCKKTLKCKLVLIDDILLLSIPAEVNSKYIQIVESEFPKINIVPMGYAEKIVGYLPHWSEVKDGGYEVDSYSNYGWDKNISIQSLKETEFKILDEIRKIQKEV
jgi:hypothetical protein